MQKSQRQVLDVGPLSLALKGHGSRQFPAPGIPRPCWVSGHGSCQPGLWGPGQKPR